MNKQSKIFIAGKNGFVGKSLTKSLITNGYNNLLLPSRQELDLENQEAVSSYFKKNNIEFVFHCAGYVGGIKENENNPFDFIHKNLRITLNILESAAQSAVKKLLFLGSSCMYPVAASKPFKEVDLFSGELEKTNHAFAVAKLAGYELCRSISLRQKKPFITAIPTGLYGENDNFNPESGHVIPSLMKRFWVAQKNNETQMKIWGSGQQIREFLYVDDCTEALIEIMRSYNEIEAINVGMGEKLSIKELALKIKEICGYKGEIVFDTNQPEGMKEKYLSSEKMKQLNWNPKVSLHQGLQKTWQWAVENIFES